MNVLAEADCAHERRSSQAVRYTAENGRPDKIGQYSLIVELMIDAARAGRHAMLRPWGWRVTVLVSEDIANCTVPASGAS